MCGKEGVKEVLNMFLPPYYHLQLDSHFYNLTVHTPANKNIVKAASIKEKIIASSVQMLTKPWSLTPRIKIIHLKINQNLHIVCVTTGIYLLDMSKSRRYTFYNNIFMCTKYEINNIGYLILTYTIKKVLSSLNNNNFIWCYQNVLLSTTFHVYIYYLLKFRIVDNIR